MDVSDTAGTVYTVYILQQSCYTGQQISKHFLYLWWICY